MECRTDQGSGRTRFLKRLVGRGLVSAAMSWLGACTFSVDYEGASFQCNETTICPTGFACVEGSCLPDPEPRGGGRGSADSGPMAVADAGPTAPPGDAGTAQPDTGAADASVSQKPSPSDGGEPAPDPVDSGEPSADSGQDIVPDPCGVQDGAAPPDGDGDGVCDALDVCEGNDAWGDADNDGLCDTPAPGWAQQSLPYASGAATAVALSDGLHYLGGARDFVASQQYRRHDVYRADTDSWSTSPADVPDGDTWGARAHAYEDRLYLLGGYPGGTRFRVYDPGSDQWSSLAAPPREFLWGFASGVIDGALYAFGGVADDAGYKYDFATQQWSAVTSIPQNSGRGPLASAVVGSRLYVLNGNADGASTSLQVYDSAANSWSSGPSLAGRTFEAAATAVEGDRIWFFGGSANHDLVDSSNADAVLSNAVWIFDTSGASWLAGPAMDVARTWAAGARYADRFYILGGFDPRSTQLSSYEVY